MAVHQLIPSFVPGDATGQAALHLQHLLRRMGRFGELYASEVGPGLESLAHPASALRPAPEDLGPLSPRHRLAAEQPADAPALPPRARLPQHQPRALLPRHPAGRGARLRPGPARRDGALRGGGHRRVGLQLRGAARRRLPQRPHRAALHRARALLPGQRRPRHAPAPGGPGPRGAQREPRGPAQALRGSARAARGAGAHPPRRAPAAGGRLRARQPLLQVPAAHRAEAAQACTSWGG